MEAVDNKAANGYPNLFSRECDDQLKTLQPYETIPEAKFLKHFRTGVGRVKRS